MIKMSDLWSIKLCPWSSILLRILLELRLIIIKFRISSAALRHTGSDCMPGDSLSAVSFILFLCTYFGRTCLDSSLAYRK